jgi:hypothetical protein
MMTHANPTPSSAATSMNGAASPSLALLEARQLRDALKLLLRKEQSALAGFLVALSDFDRRRGWEPLGHASLFAFLIADLGLSKSAAYYRRSAAELLQRFPEIIAPLGEGKLCLSTVGELAKVLTEANRAVVTPRFFGLSSREAQELVAELQPRHIPSTRLVVTRVLDQPALPARVTQPALALTAAPRPAPASAAAALPMTGTAPNEVPRSRFPTSGIANGGDERPQAPRDDIEPLTADLRRLHITVSRQLLKKLESAQVGLGHARPGATMEQVIDAAVDLLLEKQARARGQVKKPRATPTAQAAHRGEGQMVATTAPRLEVSPLTDGQRTGPGTCSIARSEGRPIDPAPAEPPPHRPPRTHPRRRAPRRLGARRRPLLLAAGRRRPLRLDAQAGARPHRALGLVGRLVGGQPAPHLQRAQQARGAEDVRRAGDGPVPRGEGAAGAIRSSGVGVRGRATEPAPRSGRRPSSCRWSRSSSASTAW